MTERRSQSQAVELPPLPSGMRAGAHTEDLIVFHAFDMQAYANAAIAQDRAARAQAEPVAWQWRKRHTWFAGKPDETSFWSEWEALQPPYMDARDLAKSDPANYEIRPLYASPTIPQAAEVPGFVLVPREPTPAMMRVGLASMWPRAAYQNAAVENVWIRMCRVGADPSTEEMTLKAIAAAPTPTASAPKAEGEAVGIVKHLPKMDVLWFKHPSTLPENTHLYATQPPSEADRTREGGDVVAAKLAMIEHPFLLTWGEELAKALEGNHVISGGNGPNWIAGWETANSCAADLVRLRVQQATSGATTSEGAKRSFSHKPQPDHED